MSQAVLNLQRNQPGETVRILEALRPYELGVGPASLGFDINHFRGLAYLNLRDGVKAAAEFQRILDHQGVNPSGYEYYLAHLNLGRAYALQGDKLKARNPPTRDFFRRLERCRPGCARSGPGPRRIRQAAITIVILSGIEPIAFAIGSMQSKESLQLHIFKCFLGYCC